jgi:hypothetical protein
MGQVTTTKKQGYCFPLRPFKGSAFCGKDAETAPTDIISAYMNGSTNDRTFVHMIPQGFFTGPLPVDEDTCEFNRRWLRVVLIETLYLKAKFLFNNTQIFNHIGRHTRDALPTGE